MKLENVAEISLGYSFRKGIEKFRDGDRNLLLVQARDLPADGFSINEEVDLVHVSLENMKESSFLLPEDILLSYRGSAQSKLKASVFQIRSHTPTLASSSLCVIRLNTKKLLPEYLTLYLNSSVGQKQLQSMATGATVRAVSLRELRDFDIPIPEKEKQQAVISLWKNIQSQNGILRRRIQLQEKLVDDFISLSTKFH